MANRDDNPAGGPGTTGGDTTPAEDTATAAPTAATTTATADPAAEGDAASGAPADTTPAGEEPTEEAAPVHDPESAPWTGPGAWVFPGLVALFGVIAVWGALTIESPPNSAPPGPSVVPGVIGVLLLVVAAKMAVDNLRVARALAAGADFGPPAPPTEWSPVLLTLGALAVHVALLEPLGWLLAGTLLFWGVSYAFGARNPRRDAVVSLSMSAAVQVGFSFGLGLNLPGGVLEMVL
ncbi:tripartite tricarboxylate transporter TctB family protein [Streptomyces lonarensis]|uniref:Tripartite tricarboxylate transporter TctB family protein n=1 Tax=Streptomyces lonarensis TaxID=700599 RepID=A0A7X6D3M9_9ACTN|nr:tripartite tricarboxylate transporter TctB family protein [Streptomyces lonarensis]NJQ07584.1 tripartite tricarboxylate transporter TctB family protein [Streptomyces lonarensis]